MKTLFRLLPALLVALALDGLTKAWAEQALRLGEPVPVVGQVVRLTLGYNTGVAFGLFANGGPWPLLVTGLIIGVLVIGLWGSLRAGELPRTAAWPAGLMLGGAIANFADRLPDGRVTDFLDFGLSAQRWPTFNLADSFIVFGLALLLIINLREKPPQSATPAPNQAES